MDVTLSPVAYATPALSIGAGTAMLGHVFIDARPEPFLLTLGVLACAGGLARLMYDTAAVRLTWRQQAGRVALSVMGSLSIAMMLWDQVHARPMLLMGFCTGLATAGPGLVDSVNRWLLGRAAPKGP